MNLYCIKCWKLTNDNAIKIKHETDRKNNTYSFCIDYGFEKFETVDEEELSDLLKILNYI